MSAAIFRHTCRCLLGPQWQTEASRRLGLSLRSVTRYDDGEREIPRVVFVRLSKLIDERLGELGRLQPRVRIAREGL